MEPIISVRDLHFTFPGESEPVLNGLSMDIDEGSFVVILGRNGSGKSTLARHLNGIFRPDSGSVLVAGRDTAGDSRLLDIRRTVGLVFQNPDNQIVSSVVEEDVAFAPENLGVPSGEIRRRVDEALKAVDMYDYRLHSPHLLSGGQKQRIAIAGVIAMRPRCIVLDEPTAMLDPSGRREVLDTVKRLCRRDGMTVVLITHHMYEAADADKVYVMSHGKLALQGEPREVFSNAELLRAEGLSLPDTTELVYRLREAGMKLPEGLLTVEECARAISAAIK